MFKFPYTNFHELNLDWIIGKIKMINTAVADAAASALSAAASKTSAASSAAAANTSKEAAAGSATLAAVSAQQAQNLVDQLDTTIAEDVEDWLDAHITPTSPIVDDTLTISGAAADAAVTGSKIAELSGRSYNLYEGKISGATIASNGKIGTSTLFDMFYAPVESGKTYSVRLKDTTASSFVAFFAAMPTAGATSYNSTRTSYATGGTVTAPIDGWVAYREDTGFANPQINEGVLLPYVKPVTAVDGVARAELSKLEGLSEGDLQLAVTPTVSTGAGLYIKANGTIGENTLLNMTDPIDIAPGFTVKATVAGSSFANAVAVISSYSDGAYTPLVLNSNGNTPAEYTYTAEKAEKIVISYLISAGITVTVTGNLIDSINTTYNSIADADNSEYGSPLQMFTDIVCCGDSLTYSAVFTDASHNRQAFVPWPEQIERETGIPTVIQARSGMNPKTWFAEYGSTIDQSADGNRLYITYFGHNASAQYPYTDTFETDCPANADPSTWADTLTGWWGRIINDIYASGCKALIIRVSDQNGYRATQDAIIEDIAARWNVPVIDNPYLSDEIYHSAPGGYVNEAHYNDLGYMQFCRQLMTNIGKMSLTDLGHLLPSDLTD